MATESCRQSIILSLLLTLSILLHEGVCSDPLRVAFSEGSAVGTRKLLDLPSSPANSWSLEKSNVFRLVITARNDRRDSSFLHLETLQPLDRETTPFYTLQLISSTKRSLAVIVDVLDINDNPPMFESESYSVSIPRSSPKNTPLVVVRATDLDEGRNARLKYYVNEAFEDFFTVDSHSGQVSVLDLQCSNKNCPPCLRTRAVCHVLVHAMDAGQPEQNGYTVVSVELVAANDHAPKLAVRYLPEPAANVSVVEGRSDAPLAAITVTDPDHGNNGHVDVHIPNDDHFRLEHLGTALYLLRIKEGVTLSRDNYEILIKAKDRGEPPKSAQVVIAVEVRHNTVRTRPKFDKTYYKARISEDAQVGAAVTEVRLETSSFDNEDQFVFDITNGNDQDWFSIHPYSGLIVTKRELDNTLAQSSDLIVRVQNGHGLSNESRVHIELVDVNNHAPHIVFDKYNNEDNIISNDINDDNVVYVSEDAPLGFVLGRVQVEDADFGENGRVQLEMLDANKNFELNDKNVIVSNKLDYEVNSDLKIRLTAKDQGEPSLESELVISVRLLDVDDNAPIFYPKQKLITINDDLSDDDIIATVKVLDKDTNPLFTAVRYTWDTPMPWLSLNESTGQIISSRRRADLKRHLPLQSRILATSTNRPESSSVLTLHIVKFFEPSKQVLKLSLVEDAQSVERSEEYRVVGQLDLSFLKNDYFELEIIDGDPNGNFKIDQSGKVRYKGEIDREMNAFYNLTVWVKSNSLIKDKFHLNINIEDINDNPPMFIDNKRKINLDTDTAAHAPFFRPEVIDLDENNVLRFDLEDNSNLFVIDESTGTLSLASNLNDDKVNEIFEIGLKVSDGIHEASHNLAIYISSSRNKYSPIFDFDHYEFSVSESAPLNRPVATINAIDHDQDLLIFTMINEDKHFSIFPDGQLYLKQQLDREKQSVHSFSVDVSDKRGRSNRAKIVIYLNDENDNAPRFSSSTYVFSIIENVETSEPIGRVVATDTDVGLNSEIEFVVLSKGNAVLDDLVNLDKTSGLVYINEALDREALFETLGSDVIDLEIEVKDKGNLNDKATISIVVIDDNDNSPEFAQNVYETSVSEDVEVNTSLLTLMAEDADSDDEIVYSMVSNEHFELNSETGVISVKNNLDRETMGSNVSFIVWAKDKAEHLAKTKVHVNIEDVNEFAPTFNTSRLELKVNEDLTVGTELYVFEAFDKDDNESPLLYELVDLVDRRLLQLDNRRGVLRLNNELDREQTPGFEFGVKAIDEGGLSSLITVKLNIEDINDNAPSFKSDTLRLSIREDLPIDSFVHRVHAIDEDQGLNGSVVYAIKNLVEEVPFRIDESSGDIFTTSNLDRETKAQYELVVVASDLCEDKSKRLSGEQRISVKLVDVNDHTPVVRNIEHAFVPKAFASNDVILSLMAADEDEGLNGQVDFSISNNKGYVNIRDNTIVLTKSFEEINEDFRISVVASDAAVQSGRRSASTLIDVFVEREEMGPEFTQEKYEFVVNENSEPDTIVGQIELLTNIDDIKYYIVGSNCALGKDVSFVGLDPSTGELYLSNNIDREELGDIVTIEVLAINKRFSSRCLIELSILDENDSVPIIDMSSLHSIMLDESQVPNQIIGRVIASDPDQDSILIFSLDSKTQNFLGIDSNTGDLILKRSIDREEMASVEINVIVSDTLNTANATVIIDIKDINEHPPLMSQDIYSFDVFENSASSTIVGTIRAEDKDASEAYSTVSYSLISEWGSEHFSLESDTGLIRVISDHLDFEENELFVLIASASDKGSPALTSTATVYVNIVDVNDNEPIFSPAIQRASINENTPIGAIVMKLEVKDADRDDELTFSMEVNDNFGVDADGHVVLMQNLDRETQSDHVFRVTAKDRVGHKSTCMVEIKVEDSNDNMPKLVDKSIKVMENLEPNSAMARLTATDEDEGDNAELHFWLEPNSENFTLGKLDGVLRNVKKLDEQSYILTVVVADNGHPSLQSTNNVTVIVEDVNDHRPVFNLRYYTASVYENASVGSLLLSVSALDLDPSSSLLFSLASGDPNSDLTLEPHTGLIRTTKSLDYERQRHYRLSLQVSDGLYTSEAEALINVLDTNDCVPTFPHSPYIINVLEGFESNDEPVFTVKALDQDEAPFDLIEYYLIDDHESRFRLNRSTGDLFVIKTLDRESDERLELEIVAENSGYFGSNGKFVVNVVDVNDNRPMFDNDEYFFEIGENLESGAVVGQVVATDKDQGENARITYTLKGSESFEIDPAKGLITTKAKLDREQVSQYTLAIVASDNSLLRKLSSEVQITVYVADENDNTPKIVSKGSSDFFVLPDIKKDEFVMGVEALDKDEKENAELHFSLAGTDRNFFSINENNGVVITKKSLLSKKAYSIVVRASDKGRPRRQSERKFQIFTSDDIVSPDFAIDPIIYDNENMNNINDDDVIINESVSLDTVIAELKSDADDVAFDLAGGNVGQRFEVLDNLVKLKRSLDYETTIHYELYIKAYYRTKPLFYSVKKLTIKVTDDNDNSPRFNITVLHVEVIEGQYPPFEVAQLEARDADQGQYGEITFKIVQNQEYSYDEHVFKVDERSGLVFCTIELDREKRDEYTVRAAAVDGGGRSATATIYVHVLDVNDNAPLFTRLHSANVSESASPGQLLLQLTTNDEDDLPNANVSFVLIGEEVDNAGLVPISQFKLDALTGKLFVDSPLDREQRDEYSLRVEVSDGAWKLDTLVTIIVLDENDNAPLFDQNVYHFTIDMSNKKGLVAGRVHALDRDAVGFNSEVVYSLKHLSSFFKVDENTGDILVFSNSNLPLTKGNEGHTSAGAFELNVLAKDKGVPSMSSFCTVYIEVVDNKDNENVVIIDENLALPNLISSQTVLLEASLLLKKSSYLFVTRPKFHIVNKEAKQQLIMDADSGKVYVMPDRNNTLSIGTKIDVVIGISEGRQKRSLDSNYLTKFSLTLEVTGPNLYGPKFESVSHRVIIKEDEPVNNTIVVLKAEDEDKGLNGEIRYTLIKEKSFDHTKFTVDPIEGRVIIASSLDYETLREHKLLIEAKDKAFSSKSATATVIIAVQDVDDNKPTFESDAIKMSVKENQPVNTLVGYLNAFDLDSEKFGVIEYELHSSDSNFGLNKSSGALVTKRVFDAEKSPEGFDLRVKASNPNSPLFSEANLRVQIEGQNEFRPRFEQPVFQFVVSERQQYGSVIGAVKALDNDAGEDGKIYYYLMGLSKHFSVDKLSGQIIVKSELDREHQSRHVLTILAKNRGSVREAKDVAETQCVIQVLDGNDPPMFSQNVYMVNVAEDAPIGYHVLTVTALDKDIRPRNSLFSYSIEPSLASDHFRVGANSGEIVVQKKLDREDVALINLTVIAVDNGEPPAIGRTTVLVELIDVNDSPPELECCRQVHVKENAPENTLVTVMEASDPDLPIHGQLFHFELLSHHNLFRLDEQSGELRTKIVLDREENSEIKLSVKVDDGSEQSQIFDITVIVDDENDNESRPRDVSVVVKIFEGVFNGGLLAEVRPDDPDTDDVFSCRLIEGPKSIFEVKSDCDIRAGKLKEPRVYELRILAKDNKHAEVGVHLKINFVRFGLNALNNAVAMRFVDVDAENILAFFQALTPNNRNLLLELLSFSRISNSSFDAFVSLQEDSTVLSREQAIQFLIELFDKPSSNNGLSMNDMIIDYSPCLEQLCGSNGECFSSIIIDENVDNQPIEFGDTVFKSPLLKHLVKCRCKAGFRGEKCDVQIDPCIPNPCNNGGSCNLGPDGFVCSCQQGWSGEQCQVDQQNVCSRSPCQNQGTCQPAPSDPQGFLCLCRPGFQGLSCEHAVDVCSDSPCLNGGTCIAMSPTYRCQCADNFYGKHCQLSTLGFDSLSWVAFPSLDANTNDLEIVFSTTKSDALLVYNYGTVIGGRSDFLSVELESGQPRMAWGASRTAVASVSLDKRVDTGRWHKLTVTRNHRIGTISVEDCAESGELCKICRPDDPKCFRKTEGQAGTLALSKNPLFFGGLPELQPWLERRRQVGSIDFVGCVKSLVINGYVQDFWKDAINSSGIADTCNQRQGGACAKGNECGHPDECVSLWSTHKCRCSPILASDCSSSMTPFSLLEKEQLVFRPTEHWRRFKIANEKWLADPLYSSQFSSIGLAFRTLHTESLLLESKDNRQATKIGLEQGFIIFSAKESSKKSDLFLSDGHWHSFLVELDKKVNKITLSIDNQVIMDDIEILHDFLASSITYITIGPDPNEKENEFRGCFTNFTVNNLAQEMEGDSNYFRLENDKRQVRLGCDISVLQSARPRSALGLGVGLVVAFFLFLVCAIICSFLFFRLRRKLNKTNGDSNEMSLNNDNRQPKQQEYLFEQFGRAAPIPPRLNNAVPTSPVPAPAAPSQPASPLFAAATPMAAEHYDLENASSIAPSDIDVVYHYKGFRHHNRNRGLHQTPLARLSPSSELSHPRIVTLGDLSSGNNRAKRSMESPSTIGERVTPLSHVSSARSRRARRSRGNATLTSENVAKFNKTQQPSPSKQPKSALIDTVNLVNNGSELVTNSTPVMDLHPRLCSRSSSSSSMKDDEDDDDSFTCSEFDEHESNTLASVKPERTSSTEPLLFASEGPHAWEKLLNWVPDYNAFAGVFSDIAELAGDNADRPTPIGNNGQENDNNKDVEHFI